MRLFRTALFACFLALPLQSQDDQSKALVVPFAQFPPFLFIDKDGERTGFMRDLAELIGQEIGVPIEYLDVANAREWVEAQASGRSQLIPGVLQLPPLEGSNVFSEVVATDVLLPAVLAENDDLIESGILSGNRIAIVPPALGSDEPVLSQNIPVEYESPQAAVMDLLAGKVDATLVPPTIVYWLAREARVDGRIVFTGESLRESTRHVALHESRADLLGPINDAIARLEEDGRLEELRQRYSIVLPDPPPEVLTVAIAHVPPLGVVGEDGSLSGFAIEVTNALAERAGLQIEYKVLSVADWVKGPIDVGTDLTTFLVATPERLERMDFTFPVIERQIALAVSADDDRPYQTLADLADLKVGVVSGSVFENRAKRIGTFEVIGFADNEATIAAQIAGEIDVGIVPTRIAREAINNLRAQGILKVVELPAEVIDNGIVLRPGLGQVRERLNAVIPGYLLSTEYASLRQKYFGEPEFWTPQRIYAVTGAVVAILVALFSYFLWLRRKQEQARRRYERQQAELAREQAYSEKLGKLVSELERSNRELDEFAYIASHDLKEPLRGIGINANFLLREELTEPVRHRVSRMNELVVRLEQLISDLLFFSRLGRSDAARVVVRPHDILDAIRSDLSEWLSERGGQITEIGSIPSLLAERVKVKTVLQNLIVNGIKYNDAQEKRVEVGFAPKVEVNGRTMENAIYVKDNGIGIGEEYRDKIFRIFSRLNKQEDYDSSPGTGSGLAFVRKIVEEHGGAIDFNSSPGEGSTFYVTLPLAENRD